MIARMLKAAETELDEAIRYHRTISDTLGVRFERAAYDGLTEVVNHPLMWPKIHGEHRRYRFKRFKYGIVYRIDSQYDEIVITAIMHLSREPNYWTDR